MEECLGVNGMQLFGQVDYNLEEREHELLVQCFLFLFLYNTLYSRPCHFRNGLMKLFCVL